MLQMATRISLPAAVRVWSVKQELKLWLKQELLLVAKQLQEYDQYFGQLLRLLLHQLLPSVMPKLIVFSRWAVAELQMSGTVLLDIA